MRKLNESLLNHFKMLQQSFAADESLQKFEIEDLDNDKVETTVYICRDYAICIEVYGEDSGLKSVAGTVQITTFYPNWITDKVA